MSALRRAGWLAALVAMPLAAQIARPQKARLSLETTTAELAAGATATVEAIVEIDDGWHLQAHVPTYDYLIPTVLDLELPPGYGAIEVDYPAPSRYKFSFADEELDVYAGTLRLPVRFVVPVGAAAGTFAAQGRLRYQACDDRQCLPPVETSATVNLVVSGAGAKTVAAAASPSGATDTSNDEPTAPSEHPAAPKAPEARAAPATSPPAAVPRPRSLVTVLLLALVGGFILNGMPCVLPILSLKLFGLVKAAGQTRSAVRSGALATAAGILVSFWALAAAAIAARSAGAAIGWGVQFQQPAFVAFLAVVVLFFTLNLWGLFEIVLPYRLARLADTGASSHGHGGHFASGLFATLMATPCSAPFLGTALSFALGQDAATIVATLTAVGVGLALPYLVLVAAPGAVRHLPKPGAWMDTLRGAMGFLLAGALVWLFYVLAAQVASETVAFFQLALLGVGLALFFAHRGARGGAGRRLGWVVAIALSVLSIALVQRSPASAHREASGSTSASGITWQPFDRAEAERLAASGKLVFLDITADWCVTCKVNERVVLNTPEVLDAMRRLEVVTMKADWTNRDDGIARFLAAHGRYGIPFYMLYRPGQAPHVFGELISKQGIVDVLEASALPAPG